MLSPPCYVAAWHAACSAYVQPLFSQVKMATIAASGGCLSGNGLVAYMRKQATLALAGLPVPGGEARDPLPGAVVLPSL